MFRLVGKRFIVYSVDASPYISVQSAAFVYVPGPTRGRLNLGALRQWQADPLRSDSPRGQEVSARAVELVSTSFLSS